MAYRLQAWTGHNAHNNDIAPILTSDSDLSDGATEQCGPESDTSRPPAVQEAWSPSHSMYIYMYMYMYIHVTCISASSVGIRDDLPSLALYLYKKFGPCQLSCLGSLALGLEIRVQIPPEEANFLWKKDFLR